MRGALAALLLCAGGFGCGDSDGGGGSTPRVDSDLPPSRHVEDLSDAEQQQLCDALSETVIDALSDPHVYGGFCIVEGFLFGLVAVPDQRVAVCRDIVDMCAVPDNLEQYKALEAQCTDPSASCDATVGEIEHCTDAAIAALAELNSLFRCTDLEDVEIVAIPAPPPPETDCQTLEERCPMIYQAQQMLTPPIQ